MSDQSAQQPGLVPPMLQYRPLMRLSADVRDELAIPRGRMPSRLAVCYFDGGSFHGERLSGVLLPGGGDWADVRTSDHVEIDVRALMRTHDDALIYLKYSGLWHTPPGVLHRVIAADGHKHYQGNENYFRTTARFETADSRYQWLNLIVAIGIGARTESGVGHTFFELL